MRALALLLVLLPTLAACSGADGPEEGAGSAEQVAQARDEATAEWRAAVEAELGTTTYDFDALQQDAAVDCMRTSVADWTVELALSGDTSTSGLTRVGLEHACDDVVAAFDEAVAAVEGAADPLDLVCDPGVELSAATAPTAELACANR
ncbi:hypothetical protein F4692_001889 [Nocardioides cavernae]|uniref:Uncharacterized protein n=1 Tax=Nocardioides cavernae TaxID=1921566 RepID=A0A7Y9H2I5_9ACTN|nr:hypothetical protein [Nocardioides cavernae]NYE36756.1 hypothetical protein [Nocardioides cavernae]